ncbi:hypothetical protein CHS0354_018837 [Potamilus streckersoni]|uniref:VWFD domain-containing protein n=1 Tax=Potamilus streckersoni TaxID=2493646 RepID=A0AAE0SJE7_9BIVA|nr:hypothetical protein CHS0354_018837 [Potamilus streckersoni]
MDYNKLITLPTGSKVNIANETYWVQTLNVTIYPSLTDPHETLGLCGNCDGNKLNDLTKRDGSLQHPYIASDWDYPTDFNQDWIAKDGENLFKAFNQATLSKWRAENISFCNCEKPMGLASIENRVTCSPGRFKACEEK